MTVCVLSLQKQRCRMGKSFVKSTQLTSGRDRPKAWPSASMGQAVNFHACSCRGLAPHSWQKPQPARRPASLTWSVPVTSRTSPSSTFSLAHWATLVSSLFLRQSRLPPIGGTCTLAGLSAWDISPQRVAQPPLPLTSPGSLLHCHFFSQDIPDPPYWTFYWYIQRCF